MATNVRLGILSVARIADVIADAAKQVENLEIVAIASRTPEKARAFAERHGVGRSCTYDQLIAADDVDAIYVPLPTALASKWAVKAAAVGKHILVDKPFASAPAVCGVLEAAQAAGVIFMDGTTFVHSRRARAAAKAVTAACGELRVVCAAFSCPLNTKGNIRGDKQLEPYGALGDLGWYCARAAVHYLGVSRTEVIQRALAMGSVGDEGELRELSGVVEFGGGVKLILDCSFEAVLRHRLEIAGTEGSVRIDDFVIPDGQFDDAGGAQERVTTELICDTGVRISTSPFGEDFPSPSKVERTTVEEGSVQAVHMVREFVRMISEKDMERSAEWGRELINTQRILDELYNDCEKRRVSVNGFS